MQITATPQNALEAYINADGNIHLAAERMGYSRNEISEYVQLLTQNQIALQSVLRTKSLILAFDTLTSMAAELKGAIGHLEPADLAKAFNSLLMSIDKLTSTNTTINNNLNVHEYMMNQIPPEAREALAVLMQPPTP